MAINDILEIARQGLQANRQALQTTSNNIANANTPGYSRQKPVFQARDQSMMQGVRLGGGVEVKQVLRAHDSFVQNQILEESRHFGDVKAKNDTLKRVEATLHNENFQVSELVNKFFNDVRQLSASPEVPAFREHVASSAQNAASGFRNLNSSLLALKQDIDLRLEFAVHEVNNMTRELASLNEKISGFEAAGEIPNELYDRRDQVVRDLSQSLGLQTSTDDRGHVNLNGGSLGILVLGIEARELAVQRTPASEKKGPGSVDIFVKDPGGLRRITGAITDGELGGLIHVRDKVLTGAMRHLDVAAYQFATSVNDVHREGVGLDGRSNQALFGDLDGVDGASYLIDLSDSVKMNKEAVAVGYDPDALGDNGVALKIAQLQEQKLMPLIIPMDGLDLPEPNHTLAESLNSMVARVAVESQTEEQNFNHQENIMNQLENYRQSIAGVSLEEEAINMMQYQAVFNASAKAMKVGDELFQTILGIKS